MARVKKVSRRPAASGGGLAGAPQLDLAYAYAIEQIGQIWREENIRPDPDFVAGRALTQMMPPTPAAAEQGCEEEVSFVFDDEEDDGEATDGAEVVLVVTH